MAKGFHQQPGLDYGDTFSLVVKHTTRRLVLLLAIHFGWPIRRLDAHNAFLHGVLTKEVYMPQLQGFVDPTKPDNVCRLHKAIYGHK